MGLVADLERSVAVEDPLSVVPKLGLDDKAVPSAVVAATEGDGEEFITVRQIEGHAGVFFDLFGELAEGNADDGLVHVCLLLRLASRFSLHLQYSRQKLCCQAFFPSFSQKVFDST